MSSLSSVLYVIFQNELTCSNMRASLETILLTEANKVLPHTRRVVIDTIIHRQRHRQSKKNITVTPILKNKTVNKSCAGIIKLCR